MKPNRMLPWLVLALCGANFSCQKIAGWMTTSIGKPAAKPVGSPESAPSEGQGSEEAVSRHNRNSQVLQEFYRVVWLSDPQSPAEFGNWLDSIDQGASFEGVYNAFTHSDGQRAREADPRTAASRAAVQAFAEQMAQLMLDFKELPEVPVQEATALTAINPFEEAKPAVVDFNRAKRPMEVQKPNLQELTASLAQKFNKSSVFTLKRVLGDWALRVMAERKTQSPQSLWDWYAAFASRSAATQIDFGLRLRNDHSREFHRTWAEQNPQDLLQWEVLNRLHRILNEAHKKKPDGGSS